MSTWSGRILRHKAKKSAEDGHRCLCWFESGPFAGVLSHPFFCKERKKDAASAESGAPFFALSVAAARTTANPRHGGRLSTHRCG